MKTFLKIFMLLTVVLFIISCGGGESKTSTTIPKSEMSDNTGYSCEGGESKWFYTSRMSR